MAGRRVLILVIILIMLSIGGQSIIAQGAAEAFTPFTGTRMFFSPISLDFGPVGIGSTSLVQTVTITNTGSVPLANFAGGAPGVPFNATQNCAGGVAPGASCQYFFTFTPTAAGPATSTSITTTNAGSISIQVRGEGVGPGMTISPTSLDFGYVPQGSVSAPQNVTITNHGKSILTNFAGGAPGVPFNATQNCAGGVAPGTSCQFTYTFAPTSSGSFTGVSSGTTNAGNFQVNMKGTSILPGAGANAVTTPLDFDFGPIGIGVTSPQKTVTISNNGGATLANFAGGAPGVPFNATQNCAGGVAPGGTCQFFFTFTPTQAGQATATSFSTTNGGDIVVNLRGTGVGSTATYSPLVIDFGPVVPGTTSTQQAVTIINTGLATLANFAGGAPGVPFNATQNCAGGVAPGASCQFFFTFTPLESGRYHKDSIVSTNAGNIVIELWGGEPLKLCLPVVIR